MLLAWLWPHFQSLPSLPTSELHPSRCYPGTDSRVGEFVYILGPCGLLQWTLLGDCPFILSIFTTRGFEALLPGTGTLGCPVCLAPQLFLEVYLHMNVGPPGPPATSPARSAPPATALLCILFTPPPISAPLLVWMNVSSLTPWLLDFHTVQFSGPSGCFLFLNWLLSFFWLYEEAKRTYLCIRLARKSDSTCS